MENFNNDFLNRQADPNDLGAIVQRQGGLLQQVGQGFVRVQSLDEIAAEIGALQFKAVEPSGQLRMIMSAINLLEQYGVNAHLAGFDTNGAPQFWLSADDGSIVAAAGLLTIDHNGITDTSSLMGLISKDVGNYNIIGRVWYSLNNASDNPIVQGIHTFHFVSDTPRFIDDFEDGTLAAWSTSGSPSIQTTDPISGIYYARISSANTISKTLSASAYGASTWYFVTCLYRSTMDGGALKLEYGGASPIIHGLSTMQADTIYRAFFVFQANADTTPTITFSCNSAGTIDIDDVYVQEMNTLGLGIGGTSGFGQVVGSLEMYGDINFKPGAELKFDGAVFSPTAETNANDIFRCDNPGGVSAFAGTIATLPGGATLTYNVTSGQEGAMVPTSTSQLAKMRLYNTTRGTSALIDNCVTGTNTLTLTANVPAGWQVGDVITIASQTVSGGGFGWVDIEITSGPTDKASIFMFCTIIPGAAGDTIRTHPLATYGSGNAQIITGQVAANSINGLMLVKVTTNVFTFAWTGTPTVVVLREAGYLS